MKGRAFYGMLGLIALSAAWAIALAVWALCTP
jgi:hypothetical protein